MYTTFAVDFENTYLKFRTMIKNVILAIAKNSQKKSASLTNKRAIINEMNAEHRSQSFNPKRARYKSIKGVTVIQKKW